MNHEITLNDYDIIIINSSAGKDSLCAIWEISRLAKEQNYPSSKIHISHQELGESEWKGTTELVIKQAKHFGYKVHLSKRVNNKGYEESMLEYVYRRGKFPSSTQRWCTSDFKRNVGDKVVRRITKDIKCKVLYVFGFRADESPSRKKKVVLSVNKRLTTRTREVHEFLPIHDWNLKKVWQTINRNSLPYHHAYDLGMPRLSCVFCIFSPFDALVIAGIHNPELLEKYVQAETKIGHTFKHNLSLKSVQDAIKAGYRPQNVADWRM